MVMELEITVERVEEASRSNLVNLWRERYIDHSI